MLKSSKLQGQVMIVLLLFPLNFILAGASDNIMNYLASMICLIVPLIVFWFLFWKMKTGMGTDLRFARLCVASILWYGAWVYWRYSFYKYSIFIASKVSNLFNPQMTLSYESVKNFDMYFSLVDRVISASYHTVLLALTVVLSYMVVKWIQGISNR